MPLSKPNLFNSLLLTALLSGCTTQLTEKGEKVGLVTAAKAAGCGLIDTFTVQGDSADDALNIALNKAAELGGDSLGVESVNEIGGDSEIKGVALTCLR
ncbi:DUF4156 domain-containing protein [Pseudomonas sp. GD03860]|uniref:hypothetical protein n=1 Tax=Pseudomonas sp. GD03860 TaxID=2975389 RepID=UPI00244B50A8|nr:hypothetical protein [Pseudomonas sp. GD03860]MDH0640179.1 DUF4156 domain-containing protein [Pseudomonas sp. GD03860]